MRVHRRFLTLLETLLVIFLLSLFIGLIGINVNKALHEQRFRTEVGTVVDTLRIAQYLMLILDNDVHVKFRQGDKAIAMQIVTACPLSEKWAKLIAGQRLLKTIHIINFKDHLQELDSEPGVVDLRFLSSGYVMSQGILRLATAEDRDGKEGLESYVCLPGYPAPLAAVDKRPTEPACYALLEPGFLESLTTATIAEVQALEAAGKGESKKGEEAPKDEPKKSK